MNEFQAGGVRKTPTVPDTPIAKRDFGQVFGQAEAIRKEIPYQGFRILRTDPFFLWSIVHERGGEVPGLGGSYTTLELTCRAIDQFILDQKKKREQEEALFNETEESN